MKCPKCIEEGKTSIVTPGQGSSTAMYCPSYYDTDGNYHCHDRNTHSRQYTCSEGHSWWEHKQNSCWCGWPETQMSQEDSSKYHKAVREDKSMDKSDESIHSTGDEKSMTYSGYKVLKPEPGERIGGIQFTLEDGSKKTLWIEQQEVPNVDEVNEYNRSKTAKIERLDVPYDFQTQKEKIENIKRQIQALSDEAQVQIVKELAEEWDAKSWHDKLMNEPSIPEDVREGSVMTKWAEEQLKDAKMPTAEQDVDAMMDGSAIYRVTGEGVEYKGPKIGGYVIDGPAAVKQRTDTRSREEWLAQYQNKEYGNK